MPPPRGLFCKFHRGKFARTDRRTRITLAPPRDRCSCERLHHRGFEFEARPCEVIRRQLTRSVHAKVVLPRWFGRDWRERTRDVFDARRARKILPKSERHREDGVQSECDHRKFVRDANREAALRSTLQQRARCSHAEIRRTCNERKRENARPGHPRDGFDLRVDEDEDAKCKRRCAQHRFRNEERRLRRTPCKQRKCTHSKEPRHEPVCVEDRHLDHRRERHACEPRTGGDEERDARHEAKAPLGIRTLLRIDARWPEHRDDEPDPREPAHAERDEPIKEDRVQTLHIFGAIRRLRGVEELLHAIRATAENKPVEFGEDVESCLDVVATKEEAQLVDTRTDEPARTDQRKHARWKNEHPTCGDRRTTPR